MHVRTPPGPPSGAPGGTPPPHTKWKVVDLRQEDTVPVACSAMGSKGASMPKGHDRLCRLPGTSAGCLVPLVDSAEH